MYEVEEKRKKIKQIIIYVIMLLSVLCCSAFAGVNVAKVYKVGEIKAKSGEVIEYKKSQTGNQINSNQNILSSDEIKSAKITNEQVNQANITQSNISNTISNNTENVNTPSDTNTSVSNNINYSNFVKQVDNIYDGEQGKRVFLTFDDGPSKSVTPHILDILKFHNIKATFFVLGSRVKLNPELVKREYDEGHYIANHGYNHNNKLLYSNMEHFKEEVVNTDIEISKAIGVENYCSHIFRFPNGFMSKKYSYQKKEAVEVLNSLDYSYIDWNCLNKDS